MVAQVFPLSRLGTAAADDRCMRQSYPWAIPAQEVSPQPLQVLLMIHGIPGWEFLQPIPLEVTHDEDGYFNIADTVFDVYGDGKTSSKALGSYIEALTEFYELVSVGAQSNSFDRVLLQRLQQYLHPTNP